MDFLLRDGAQAVGLKLPENRNVDPQGLSENRPSEMLAPEKEMMGGSREEEAFLLSMPLNLSSNVQMELQG